MSDRCLVVPGMFVPANEPMTQLVYKQLRLLPLEYDVCSLSCDSIDQDLARLLEKDEAFSHFHIHEVGKYNDVLFSIKNIDLFKGLRNMKRYVESAVSMYDGQKFLYTSSFPCYTTRVGMQLKKAHPELIWLANFTDPIHNSPYKDDPMTYKAYSLPEKVAFKLYCRYYVVDQDEINAMEHADHLIFICEEQRDFMIEQYLDMKEHRMSKEELLAKSILVPLNYVPEWNRMHIDPSTSEKKTCTLAHFGRIYGRRLIEEFIYALDLFQKEHPDLDFRVEQYGEMRKSDLKRIKQLGLEKTFLVHDKIPYDQCLAKMNEADAVLLFDTILPEQKIQPYLPSKLIEYSMLKKNVLAICDETSPTCRIMKKTDAIACTYERKAIQKGLEAILIDHRSSLVDYCATNEEAVLDLKTCIEKEH